MLSEREGYHMADFTLNKKAFQIFTHSMPVSEIFLMLTELLVPTNSGSTHGAGGTAILLLAALISPDLFLTGIKNKSLIIKYN